MPEKNNQSFDEREIVFHYSRERRLANASETVRELNKEGRKHSFNLLRPLTATKPLAFMFMSIIILFGVMLIFSFLFGGKKETVLGGNIINVSAFTFEGKTYLTVNKKIQDKKNFYTGTVDLAFSPVINGNEQHPDEIEIETSRIYFTFESEEDFKMALPFEAEKLLILLQSEKEIQRLTVTAK